MKVLFYSTLIILCGVYMLHNMNKSNKLVEKYVERLQQLDCIEIYNIDKMQVICKSDKKDIYVSPTSEIVLKIRK